MNALFPLPLLSADAAMFAATLDGLEVALYLVAASMRLVHVNTAGRAIINAGDVLLEVRRHLVASDPAANQALQRLITPCVHGGDASVPMIGTDGQRYVAHVLQLSSDAHRCADLADQAIAALFVRKVALTISPNAEVIGKAFNLTPAELRVLLAIVERGSVPEASAALGIAASTVKTHLSRLFEKTGAARQADFVKLVAGYATPLRHAGVSQ
jgi:DNA-binding CsgD family transcriptional regulator